MPDIAFDHQDPAFVADPYPALRRLQETAPVFRSERMGAWVVTRHADVRAAFRDPRLSSDRIRPFVAQLQPRDAQEVAALRLQVAGDVGARHGKVSTTAGNDNPSGLRSRGVEKASRFGEIERPSESRSTSRNGWRTRDSNPGPKDYDSSALTS